MKALLHIALLAFVLALGGRLTDQGWQSSKNEKLTADLCGVIGNYLEVGSLREAFEGLSQGLVKSGRQNACVGLIDNGRSFAPDCMDPAQGYQTTVCKAEGNKGVRAEIRYPTMPLFGLDLTWLTLCVALALILVANGLRAFTAILSQKIAGEIEMRLSQENVPEQRAGFLIQGIDWLLDRLGVSSGIRRKTAAFETQLKKFELRVREEAALRARNEAEAEKAAEYIEKVRQIRHDIRSPLSALFALKDVVAGDDLARQTLGSAITRIEAMVDDLNQVDRVEVEPVLTIAEVLGEEAVATHRQKFLLGKNVTVSLEYGEVLSPVMTLPDQFRRILDNLLENAFDAVAVGGKIRVRISRDAKDCVVAIEDNGAGVRPENLSRLFTKGGTFGKVNGLGLGLFHARHTLESWKGSIDCEPMLEGTRLIVTLPLAQAGVSFVGLAGLGPVSVIDDDPAVARLLADAGHEIVHTATTFAAGKEILRAADALGSTILLDYRLDGNQLGTDLIESIADRKNIILCTNDFDDLELIRKARHLGVRILPKPLCFYAERRQHRQQLAAVK